MVAILDTTLREGEQMPGVYFDTHIKAAIAQLLDEIGVDYIEVGHPAVDPDIKAAVTEIANRNLRANVCAHSRSLQQDVDLALECGVDFLGIFYCVSNRRLEGVFRTDLDAAIGQITKLIKYVKGKNPDLIVRYTPEDTVRSEFDNVVKTAIAAVQAGADVISIADTTGHMIPGTERNMYDYVKNLKQTLAANGVHPKIAAHLHNDRGLAVANALDAIRGGADIIDTTVLGIGERAGIVDLATILAVLKQDFDVENDWKLHKLQELYNLVSKHALPIPPNAPVMGANAFKHCAGAHVQAAVQNPLHYQSLDPATVGRKTEMSLDHMSGITSVQCGLELIGEEKALAHAVLPRVKAVGKKGRTVDLQELKLIAESVKQTSCVLLFGGAGVGKTTLANKLAHELNGRVLDRRAIVTEHVLPLYKRETGAKAEKRKERIAATQWYIGQGNPGLAKIVQQLITKGPLCIGDVLRDKEEVDYVLKHMPNAVIIALDASDDVRARRISGRLDPFDQLPDEEKEKYEEVAAIVQRDNKKHKLHETIVFLRDQEGVLSLNTEEVGAEACLQQALKFLQDHTMVSCTSFPPHESHSRSLVRGSRDKLTGLVRMVWTFVFVILFSSYNKESMSEEGIN